MKPGALHVFPLSSCIGDRRYHHHLGAEGAALLGFITLAGGANHQRRMPASTLAECQQHATQTVRVPAAQHDRG